MLYSLKRGKEPGQHRSHWRTHATSDIHDPLGTQVVQATVIPDDRSMLTGALKLAPACRQARRALLRELEAYARLVDQRDIPQVLAWAATDDGTSAAAILFDCLPGTLADEIHLRLRLLAATNPALPHPTRDAPLYTPHEYWPLIHKLAALLAVAHARGIVHADVKPANILLDAARNPKLADWGIFLDAPGGDETDASEGGARTVRGPYGTAGYCLPELAGAGAAVPVHFSIDTQALALTVVEMLLGMLPEHAREVYEAGELGEYLPPGDVQLRTLILSTLRANPAERVPVSAWLNKRSRAHCVPEPRIGCLAVVPTAHVELPAATASQIASGEAQTATASTGFPPAADGGCVASASSDPWRPDTRQQSTGSVARDATNDDSRSGDMAAASRQSSCMASDAEPSGSRRNSSVNTTQSGPVAGPACPESKPSHCPRPDKTSSAAALARKSPFMLALPEIADLTPAASSAPADSLAHSRTSASGCGDGGRRSSAGAAVHVTTNPCFADGTVRVDEEVPQASEISADGFGSLPAVLTKSLGSMQLYTDASLRGGGQTVVLEHSDTLTALAPSPVHGVSSVVFTGTLDSYFARAASSVVLSGTLDSYFAQSGDLPRSPCKAPAAAALAGAPFFDSIAEDVGWGLAGGGGVVGFCVGGSGGGESVELGRESACGAGIDVGCGGVKGAGGVSSCSAWIGTVERVQFAAGGGLDEPAEEGAVREKQRWGLRGVGRVFGCMAARQSAQ